MKKFFKLLCLCCTFVFLSNGFVFAFNNESKNNNFTICIDPGHQNKGDSKLEPVDPNNSAMKPRVSSGTAGVGTKIPEYKINLEAALILKDILSDKDYNIIMTREINEINISNIERAKIANDANADMTIRIHCDSINNSGKTGASILIPSKDGKFTGAIYEKSNEYAKALKENLENSGVKVNGIFERKDITGFNWSKVPVVILEMGFMSNWNEDKMLADSNYQRKLMEAVAAALEDYKNKMQ